jgi:ankyrin repeat protein
MLLAAGCTRQAPPVPHQRLVAAVRADSLAAVLTLLDQGEDPNRPGADGALPLGEAVRLGRDSIAGELLRSGASPADTDATGHTAFDWAMEAGRPAIADRLIRAAAVAAGGGPRVMRWFDAVANPAIAAADWRDVLSGELLSLGLMAAALHDRVDLIGSMRRAHEIPNRTGYHALAVAARWGRDEAAWALLGIDTHPDLVTEGRWRSTPLMEAARDGHVTIARRLLRAGARVNRRDAFGETALHWAARGGHRAFVAVLLAAGADPAITSLADSSAAAVAIAAGHNEVAALITGSAGR